MQFPLRSIQYRRVIQHTKFCLFCSPLCPWFLAECLAHSSTQATVDEIQKVVERGGGGDEGWAAGESSAQCWNTAAKEAGLPEGPHWQPRGEAGRPSG